MMTCKKQNRQGVTNKGLKKRVGDMKLGLVREMRQAGKVVYPLKSVLTLMVVSMTTLARSLRSVEQRSAQMAGKHGRWLGVKRRVADNTLGKVIRKVRHEDVLAALHRMVKAEHRRGNLKPTSLPVGTVAVDGKNTATLQWRDLCRAVGLRPSRAPLVTVQTRLAKRFPHVQFCVPEYGQPYGLIRSHTVTLISSGAAVCIHLRPVEGDTNEMGAFPALLEELRTAYKRTRIFQMVTTDAGNTSLNAANLIKANRWDYFCQIKSVHGELYAEASKELTDRPVETADWTEADKQNGRAVSYHVWRYDLDGGGWMDWVHARQLVRVRRQTIDSQTGEVTVGNRYYVTCCRPETLSARQCLQVARHHWRCEDNTHWTVDTILQEDRRRHAWSRHPNGLVTVSVLRMAAMNIMAVLRQLSRLPYSLEMPTWHQVAEHFLLVLCETVLKTGVFDEEVA
jgi:hypothetical protein